MLGFYKAVHQRVTELKSSCNLEEIANKVHIEFAMPFEEAKDFVCLCALADSLVG